MKPQTLQCKGRRACWRPGLPAGQQNSQRLASRAGPAQAGGRGRRARVSTAFSLLNLEIVFTDKSAQRKHTTGGLTQTQEHYRKLSEKEARATQRNRRQSYTGS